MKKKYLSIPREIRDDINIIAFDKLDGSNIRAEWSPKRGFYKFGSRKVLLGADHDMLGGAIKLVNDTYGAGLEKVFKEQRWNKNVVCFFEYYGPSSFAGYHDLTEDFKVTLLDVSPFRQGYIPPRKFIKLFGHLGIPDVLYQGYADAEFVASVRNLTLKGIDLEGVVCKAPNPNGKVTSQPIMFKIKTQKWLGMLKTHCGDDEKLYKELM